jgi:hypothetical protein
MMLASSVQTLLSFRWWKAIHSYSSARNAEKRQVFASEDELDGCIWITV